MKTLKKVLFGFACVLLMGLCSSGVANAAVAENGFLILDDGWLVNYTGSEKNVKIPDTVKKIGQAVFHSSDIESVVIPSSVQTIDNAAFYQCKNLKKVDIAEGVKTIGVSAFYNCSALTDIKLPSTLKSLGESAFSGCISLTSINIPWGIGTINKYAFNECSGLKSVSISLGVKAIGQGAFRQCSALSSINIPSTITSIGKSAFYNAGLTKIVLPGSITSIEPFVFYGNTKLTEVYLPNSIKSLGQAAFYSCTGLTHITLPTSLKTIADNVFNRCSGLKVVKISDGVTSIDTGCFQFCSALTKVTIPSSVTYLGQYIFNPQCVKLSDISFGGSKAQWEKLMKQYGSEVVLGKTNPTIRCSSGIIGGPSVKPKSVKVSPAKYTLDVEKKKTVQLTATVSPEGADRTITWTPSNKNVVTVDKNGLVTAVGRGTATVTATTSNKKKATCRITVTGPIKIKTFKMSKSSATIDLKKKSKTLQLKVNVSPSNATNKTVTWKSSNKAVATVKPNGQKATVTGLKGGYTDIIATGENGAKIAKCRITVKEPIKVTGVTLDKSTAEVKVKKSVTLKATLTPANPTNKKVKWSSSNTRIATVNSKGKVTGKKPGTVTITVTTDDGKKTATCEVTVKEATKKK